MRAPTIAVELPVADGPVEPLPALPIRRWPGPVGFLFFLWALVATCTITIACACWSFVLPLFDPTGVRVWNLTKFWARCLLAVAGVRVVIETEGELPDGPCIFAGNHQGAYDILAFFVGIGRLGRRFVFIAKKQVFRYPFLGWHISQAGYIPVDRSNRGDAIRSLEKAGERIRGGVSVAVFPEGTRSQDGSILPFKKGPFMVALKAQVPIVPVAIEGSLQVNPKRRWYVCPNTIRILVGRPIPTAGLGDAERDELMARVRTSIIRLHRRLGGLGGDLSNHIAAAGLEGIGRPEGQSK